MGHVIRTERLTKRYGTHDAVVDVDLSIDAGEVFGYLGPNGAGKTTTIRLLMGMLRPTAGRATVFGLDSWRDAPAVHARTGYVPGDPALYDRLTGAQLLDFVAHQRGGDARAHGDDMARRLDLDLTRPIRTLSRGNRQKVALAQAFMGSPDLLVLDEPTSGLDPLVQLEFHRLVREHAAGGGTVLLSSHVLNEVQQIADRVGIIRAGRLVAVERLSDLRARSLHHVTARLTGAVDAALFRAVAGVQDVSVDGGSLRCSAAQPALDAVVKLLAAHHVVDLEVAEATLDETFLAYYGEGDDDAARHRPEVAV
jgi:ABC-2 type transport system ATP-binding protein